MNEDSHLVSRLEEIVLLAIWRLQPRAYGIPIHRQVKRAYGRPVLSGSVYASLGRLLKRGLAESFEGDPTPERGGRRKIFYRLTKKGRAALLDVRRAHLKAWENLPALTRKP
jgi:DNA-binding PadR family transcriptional regulator